MSRTTDGRRRGGGGAPVRRFFLFSCLFLTALAAGVFVMPPAGATLNSLQEGMKAPDFALKDMSGRTKTFADVKGHKLTVLVFWSTWSVNSGKALKSMETLYGRFKDKGLSVVAVDVDAQNISDKTLLKIKNRIESLKIDYPVLLDYGLVAFHNFGVIAVPTTVALDTNRIIKTQLSGFPVIGGGELSSYIASFFEPGASSAAKVKTVYEPAQGAARCYGLGRRMLRSPNMASMAPYWFKKAIKIDPKFALPDIALGDIHAKNGNLKLAIQRYQEALKKAPGNAVAMCKLGKILADSGKTDEGKAMLEKAIKKDGSYTPGYYYLGYLYGMEGNLRGAKKMFGAAARMNLLDPELYIYEGRVYEKNGKIGQAASAYGAALKLDLKR